jgi:hypothetical protein
VGAVRIRVDEDRLPLLVFAVWMDRYPAGTVGIGVDRLDERDRLWVFGKRIAEEADFVFGEVRRQMGGYMVGGDAGFAEASMANAPHFAAVATMRVEGFGQFASYGGMLVE